MSAPRDYIGFFEDMLLEAKLAQQFLAGVEYSGFLGNLERQRTVIQSRDVITEAARYVAESIIENANSPRKLKWQNPFGEFWERS